MARRTVVARYLSSRSNREQPVPSRYEVIRRSVQPEVISAEEAKRLFEAHECTGELETGFGYVEPYDGAWTGFEVTVRPVAEAPE